MRTARAYLRSLDPQLPRPVWLLQAGGLVNALGNGLIYPFVLIYLHNVRGISLGTAGLVVATNALVGFVANPIAGAIVDRVGGRLTLTGSLVVSALGLSLFPLIDETWHAFAAMAIVGAGVGGFWPGQSTLIAGLIPPERRPAAYSVQRITMNLGIGLGGLTGGLIATTDRPGTFTLLFVLDALTCLVFAAVLTRVPEPRLETAGQPSGGYLSVLGNRIFLGVIALNALLVASGYAMIELLGVFAKNEASVTERGIGLIWLVNTVTIVVAQLPITKFLEGKRRMRAYLGLGVVWAISWLVVLAAGAWLEAGAAVLVLALAMLVFGLGECIHGTVQAPLVMDLAPPSLRGRYVALSATSWSVGFVAGPAIGGFVLDAAPLLLWPGAATVCLLTGWLAIGFERRLPQRARRSPSQH
nr:MFS transporter [Actinomycetota bacterium]